MRPALTCVFLRLVSSFFLLFLLEATTFALSAKECYGLRSGNCEDISLEKGDVHLESVRATSTAFRPTFRPLNINNTGSVGATYVSVIAHRLSEDAAVQCAEVNTTACSLLINLCLLMHYDMTSLPCQLYTMLLSKGITWLSPLHYNDTSALPDYASAIHQIKFEDLFLFYVDVYDWRGFKKGTQPLSSVLNLCSLEESNASDFSAVGSNRELSCPRVWPPTEKVKETDFFELFRVDSINATRRVPIPVMINYSNYDIQTQDVRDLLSNKIRLYRRFFVYDVMGGRGNNSFYATILRRAVAFTIVNDGVERTPLLVLQYASAQMDASGEQFLHVLQEEITLGVVSNNETVDHALMITLIVICCVCFFSSWVRTCGWMRRRQNMMIDFGAVVRFLVYFCNHIGNMCAIVVVLASWYILAVFRLQQESVNFVVNDRYIYLDAMLFTATVTKGIFVIYRVLEQCNADYFVIDWERSKGQLLRENRILPVSMWRSTFVANELNELQMLRRWRPLLSMTIVLFFLNGLNFLKYAESVSVGKASEKNLDVNSVTTLRIAVGTFVWFAVCLVLDVVEYEFYYRFLCVHPLQAFIDLCSVSNISILILPETQWGYYLHGESIHAHSDVSMEEFQQNLHLESQGNLPVRGLGGQSVCQTFEVFLSIYMRQYLYMCYAAIEAEHQRSLGKQPSPVKPGRRWHFFASVFGFSRKSREHSAGMLAIKKRINSALQQSVRSAEGILFMKSTLHSLFELVPNILYMNGLQSGDKGGKDLFFVDDAKAYGKSFLYGIDIDIFVLYTMLYTTIDASLHNVYVALMLTFLLDVLLCWYRTKEGLANISSKTLIDDRFFL